MEKPDILILCSQEIDPSSIEKIVEHLRERGAFPLALELYSDPSTFLGHYMELSSALKNCEGFSFVLEPQALNRLLFLIESEDSYPDLLSFSIKESGLSPDQLSSLVNQGLLSPERLSSLIDQVKIVVFLSSSLFDLREKEIGDIVRLAGERQKVTLYVGLNPPPPIGFFTNMQEIVLSGDALSSEEGYTNTANKIYTVYSDLLIKERAHEVIARLSKAAPSQELYFSLTDLIPALCREVERYPYSTSTRRGIYIKLLQGAELLLPCLDPPEVFLALEIRDFTPLVTHLGGIYKRSLALLDGEDFRIMDLFLVSFALEINYTSFYAYYDLLHIRLNGSTSLDRFSEWFERQRNYVAIYDRLMVEEGITEAFHGKYPEEEIPFILNAKEHLIPDQGQQSAPSGPARRVRTPDGAKEEEFKAIAELALQSNQLFQQLGCDCPSIGFLRCLKDSYVRLRTYSEVMKCPDIRTQCIAQIAEINRQLEQYGGFGGEPQASAAEVGLSALLGRTLPGSDSFDVFLSYKHEDEATIKEIYHFLNRHSLNPFFDSITLPELSQSEYEAAIMKALDNSRHFIVVLTDLKQLGSHWIQLEMSTFRHEIVEGRKRDANFILLVSDEVDQEIKASNKTCLDIEYRGYEIIRIDSYQKMILQYLK